jgi:site-specific recombinase XerD
MIESLFKQESTRIRLRSGPLSSYLPGIAGALQQEQYPAERIRQYVRVAEGLGRWLDQEELNLAETDEATVTRYRNSLVRRKNGQLCAAGRGLPKLLMLLRDQHAIREPEIRARTEDQLLLEAYSEHLENATGLAPGTRARYLRYAGALIAAISSSSPFDVVTITPGAIVDFVRECAAKLKPSGCAAPTTAIRSFLRFLVTRRGLAPGLVDAVPRIRQWKQQAIPKHLSAEQVDGALATCDEKSPAGLRDRAILLLLYRLALRAGEVGHLRLSDIDWTDGSLRVHCAKSARERRLPLPGDVGQALEVYLRKGRPTSAEPYVFLRTRAPFSPLTGSTTVSCLAKRHLKLAGISIRGLSAHAFRHTAATQMVRRGASFKQVADTLGHRLLETTAIYAKLDEDTLQRVALPWPGGQA